MAAPLNRENLYDFFSSHCYENYNLTIRRDRQSSCLYICDVSKICVTLSQKKKKQRKRK